MGVAVCLFGMAPGTADGSFHMIICTVSGAKDLGVVNSASSMSPLSCPYCASLLIAIAAAAAMLTLPNRGSTAALDL
jgi:hypothetical protein